MPETMKLPFKKAFFGGDFAEYFVEKTSKSFSKIKILSRGRLLDIYDRI